MDFSAKLDILITKAPALREAGVLKLSVDGVSAELMPAEQTLPEDLRAILDDAQGEMDADPMNDPSTYGLPEGASTPGFARLKKAIDERS